MVTWAGGMITFYGTAHFVGALTLLGAGRHAVTWLDRALWREDLTEMSPAMGAYWLSVNSFGPPLVLLGLTVLWLGRRGITPPPLIGWSLATWCVINVVILGPGVGQDRIALVAAGLLIVVARRARRPETQL